MKKLFFTIFLFSAVVMSAGFQTVFAQETVTQRDIDALAADENTEIIRNPDGTIEIRKKVTFFEQFKIPKEIFFRTNFGYKNPILNDKYIYSPLEISSDPFVIGTNAFLAILVFLIVGLACSLMNNVLESHGDDINKFINKIPVLRLFHGENLYRKSFFKKLILIFILIVFALIAAYISPDFDLFKQKNLGILILTLLSVIVAAYAKDTVSFIIARRNDWPAFFKPNILGFFLAVLCVVLSRNVQISPGFLFGIPMGLFIFSKQFEENEGKYSFSILNWMFFFAVAAWFAAPFTGEYEVIYDFLNLTYVILLEGLFFELFPLAYLSGGAIYKWSRFAWAAIFGVVCFFLLHTLFNPNSTIATIQQNPPARNTLIILGIFVVICFSVWGIAKIKPATKN